MAKNLSELEVDINGKGLIFFNGRFTTPQSGFKLVPFLEMGENLKAAVKQKELAELAVKNMNKMMRDSIEADKD